MLMSLGLPVGVIVLSGHDKIRLGDDYFETIKKLKGYGRQVVTGRTVVYEDPRITGIIVAFELYRGDIIVMTFVISEDNIQAGKLVNIQVCPRTEDYLKYGKLPMPEDCKSYTSYQLE